MQSVDWDCWLTLLSRFESSSTDFIQALLKLTNEHEGEKAEAKEVLANYYIMQQNLVIITALFKHLQTLVRKSDSDSSD